MYGLKSKNTAFTNYKNKNWIRDDLYFTDMYTKAIDIGVHNVLKSIIGFFSQFRL